MTYEPKTTDGDRQLMRELAEAEGEIYINHILDDLTAAEAEIQRLQQELADMKRIVL